MVILTGAVITVWVTLFVQAHQLYYRFRAAYPNEARAKIKDAFGFSRQPDKYLYFLRSRSAQFLKEQNDDILLQRRSMVVRLSVAAVAIPLGGMLLLTVLAGLIAQPH